jgi:hypothetical protein
MLLGQALMVIGLCQLGNLSIWGQNTIHSVILLQGIISKCLFTVTYMLLERVEINFMQKIVQPKVVDTDSHLKTCSKRVL